MNKIKEVLKNEGRSQTWLAEQIGKSRSAVSEYCHNRSQPSVSTLLIIAKTLNVSPCDLLPSIEELPSIGKLKDEIEKEERMAPAA